jgi:hypothetical protein
MAEQFNIAAEAPVAEQDPKTQAVLEMLAQGVEATRSEPGFKAYLNLLANLYDYSPQNCLLIAMQKPDATMVNSFKRWKELGRHVMKGEKGLKIFYPYKRTIEDKDTGETRTFVTGFGIGNVFDHSQTDGEPLPERPKMSHELGSDAAAALVNRRVSAWCVDEGLTMESKDYVGSSLGFYHPYKKQIVIQSRPFIDADGMPHDDPLSVGKTRVLVHEAGHYVADHRGNVAKEDAESVAEGAAYVTMQQLGIDTGQLSLPYIAMWGGDDKRLRDNMVEIGRVSRILTTVAEGYPTEPQSNFDWVGEQGGDL